MKGWVNSLSYITDTVDQMRKSLFIVGNKSYKIPVVCSLLYFESDVIELIGMGKLTSTFTIQNLAEEYFGVIIADIEYEIGAEDIKGFQFIIRSAIEQGTQSSTIVLLVDTNSGNQAKKDGMAKQAKKELYSYTQQMYVEDMINREAKKYLNR